MTTLGGVDGQEILANILALRLALLAASFRSINSTSSSYVHQWFATPP